MPPTARESVLIVEGDPAAAPAARRQRSTGVPVHYAHGVAPACTLLRAESVSAVTAVMGRAEAGALAVIRTAARTRPAAAAPGRCRWPRRACRPRTRHPSGRSISRPMVRWCGPSRRGMS